MVSPRIVSVATFPVAGLLSWFTTKEAPKESDSVRREVSFAVLLTTTRPSPTTFGRISASSVKRTSLLRAYLKASPSRGA